MSFKPKTTADRLSIARDILEAYVDAIEELRVKDSIIVGFQIGNGNDGQPCSLQAINAVKNLAFPAKDAAQDNDTQLVEID